MNFMFDCFFFRLLEVNGLSVLGKTQQDVVNQLRSIDSGSVVNITVSRHVENLPRKLVSLCYAPSRVQIIV